MRQFNLFVFLFLFVFLSEGVFAQVTTSGISGLLTDEQHDALSGAHVQVVHKPSGTPYGAVTNQQGYFNIRGMRPGGPYEIEIKYIGFQSVLLRDVYLKLGETENFSIVMKESTIALQGAEIVASRPALKSESTTYVDSHQLNTLPTVNRSILDFTRLSPYASASGSFASRDARYNNITIDGADFNNNFGLSNKNLPGGDAQPISLDAIDAISVNVSPFDVKYSGFTGASVNAVTRSGNNDLKGSVYTYLRPKSFTGNQVGDIYVPDANETFSELYGASVGGAIIKNKLFYFVNGEYENATSPGVRWRASQDGKENVADYISRTTIADMATMKEFLITRYGYDPGSYDNFEEFNSRNWKFLARVDWNISQAHKLTLRVNAVQSENDALLGSSGQLTNNVDRISNYSMSYSNSNFKYKNKVTSLTGEWNGTFSTTVSNKLLATYTYIRDSREQNGADFPMVDIYKDNTQYLTFGTELFTPNNDVINRVFNVTDQVNISIRKHYLTAGISFEKQNFRNSYFRSPFGQYTYASIDDFINNRKPLAFSLSYGYNGVEVPDVELDFALAGVFVQDEWQLNDRFKLTYGLRMDIPVYMNDLKGNDAISDLTFPDDRKIDVSRWPASKVLFSPRFGFNWDITGDRKVVLTGGSGIFTGLLPFVWFTNQATYSGVLQNTVESLRKLPDGFGFEPDYRNQLTKYPDIFPSEPAKEAPGVIAFVDPDFKMPQVWRSSLGLELELPYEFSLSLGGMYTRDIYNVVQVNVNEGAPSGVFSGPDSRQRWTTETRRIYQNVSCAAMMTNGKEKGYQYSLNAQLSKQFGYGISGSVAYAYTQARDLTSNPGSAAASAWKNNLAVNSLNDPGLSYSTFSVPHRIVANLQYEIGCEKYKTTFSLLYTGYQAGRKSLIYNGDLNGDGNYSDLMYVPATKDELLFGDMTDKVTGAVLFSADDQRDALWAFINSNDYLSNRKGRYAERNGMLSPWLHRFDLKVAHDFYAYISGRKYGLQISLDILNVGNMFKSSWGTYKKMGLEDNYNNIKLLKTNTVRDNEPVYVLNAPSKKAFEEGTQWVSDAVSGNTWGMMLGFRVTF